MSFQALSILFTQKQPSPNSFRMNRTQKTGYAEKCSDKFTITSQKNFYHDKHILFSSQRVTGNSSNTKRGNLKGDTFRALLTIIWKSNTQKHFPTTKKSYCQETFGVEGYHVCCVHVGTLHTSYLFIVKGPISSTVETEPYSAIFLTFSAHKNQKIVHLNQSIMNMLEALSNTRQAI